MVVLEPGYETILESRCGITLFVIKRRVWVTIASYPGAQGGGERAPGTHCLCMRLISQISGKIVYFSNLPCYVDVIIN